MNDKLGVYIHIPFCVSKCGYCDFYSVPGGSRRMPDYQSALLSHISESAEAMQSYEIDSIYIGGGTPSCYGAKRITEILDELKRMGNVRLDSEITLEVNPDTVKLDELKALRREGVNRLSIGVQASNNDLLKLIGRRHNFQQAVRAVHDARRAGFDNVSIDLMYGLPSQTKSDWADTLARIIELHPEHISCYGLKLEPGTRMYKEYKDSVIMPDDDEQADMYSYAAEMLKRYGYMHYEVSNFCAPGFESRHNMKYWSLGDYMGFGPGAHSSVGNLRYSYVRDLKQYIAAVYRNTTLVDEYKNIDPLERAVEYVMLAMRTSRGISEHDYRLRCQCDWRPIEKALKAFEGKGWAERAGERWHFTVPGFLISNQLIGILLEVQATGRLEGTPWLAEAENKRPEPQIDLPMGEDELFAQMYEEHTGR